MLTRVAAAVVDPVFGPVELKPVNLTVEGRSYEFGLPQRYYDWSFMMAHFPAPLGGLRALLPTAKLQPVRALPGLGLLSLAAFEYRQAADLAPYNEFAVMVPVLLEPRVNAPALPLLVRSWFPTLGFYIHRLPVTTQQACDVGIGVWGFRKSVATIAFDETDDVRRCRWQEGTAQVATLEVRKAHAPDCFQDFVAYPVKEGTLRPTRVQTRGAHAERRRPGGASVTFGDHPIAAELRQLGVWRFALGCIYTPRAESFLHAESARIPL